MMYVFEEYLSGESAVFDSKQKAKDFAKKFNDWCFKETGCGINSNDYEITECKVNPNFDEWIKK